MTSRSDAESEEIFQGFWQYGPDDFGKPQTKNETINDLSSGVVFILYTVDNEYQKSEPAETGPVTWQ